VYHNKNVKTIRLSGLDTKHCLSLACQIMDVTAIPQDVENILIAKSQGVPAWCDQVLHELVRTGILRISPVSGGSKKQTMAYPQDRKCLERQLVKNKIGKAGWFTKNQSESEVNITKDKESSASMSRRPSFDSFGIVESQDVDPLKRILIVKSDTNIAHIPISGTLNEILLDSYVRMFNIFLFFRPETTRTLKN
jgi:hypothetical protein